MSYEITAEIGFERPILTVDVVCFTLINQQLHILLLQRNQEPFDGKLALPGGYIHVQEDAGAEDAARRVARDKLSIDPTYLEQLCTVSGRERDPRGWSASVVYLAVVTPSRLRSKRVQEFYPINDDTTLYGLPELAFDHNDIIEMAMQRLRSKSIYSSLPLFFMPSKFTMSELQQVYAAMTGVRRTNPSNFRRQIVDQGIVEPTGEMDRRMVSHRPAELFRRTQRTLRYFDREIG
jgi:8-oxo-dGTP diphosphatase